MAFPSSVLPAPTETAASVGPLPQHQPQQQVGPAAQDPYDHFKQLVDYEKQAPVFTSHPSSAGTPRDASGLSVALGMPAHMLYQQPSQHQRQQQQQQQPQPQPQQQQQQHRLQIALGLDRLTFDFDPAAANLAPMVMGNCIDTNTNTNTDTSTSIHANTSTNSSNKCNNDNTKAPIGSDLPSTASPLVSPLLSLSQVNKPTTKVKDSPSSSGSYQSFTAPSPTTSYSSTAPLSLPIPATDPTSSPHSLSSNTSVSAQAMSQAGSIAGSASCLDLKPNVENSPRPSASALTAPHPDSTQQFGPTTRRASFSRWSTSDTSTLAELSLAHKPIHHIKVTTAKTKAASVSRRKVAAPFKCPLPGCESSFTRALNLRGHLRSHTDERPYACRFCERSFARAHDKRRHEKLHLNIRPHTCDSCGKMFARLDALNRHHRQEGDTCVPSNTDSSIPGTEHGKLHGEAATGMKSNEIAFGPHPTPISASLPIPDTVSLGTPTPGLGFIPVSQTQRPVYPHPHPHPHPHHQPTTDPLSMPQGHTFYHAPNVLSSGPDSIYGTDQLGLGLYKPFNDMPQHRTSVSSSMHSAPHPAASMHSVPAPLQNGVLGPSAPLGTPLPTPHPVGSQLNPMEGGLLNLSPGPVSWSIGPMNSSTPNQPVWSQPIQRFAGHVL